MIKMTNTTCYDIEGIRVCPPEDTKNIAKYAFVVLAIFIGIAAAISMPVDNASVMGTEQMGETINYFTP